MRTLSRLVVLALALSVSTSVLADFQRGVHNYQEITVGRNGIDQLNQVELQEVLSQHVRMRAQPDAKGSANQK